MEKTVSGETKYDSQLFLLIVGMSNSLWWLFWEKSPRYFGFLFLNIPVSISILRHGQGMQFYVSFAG